MAKIKITIGNELYKTLLKRFGKNKLRIILSKMISEKFGKLAEEARIEQKDRVGIIEGPFAAPERVFRGFIHLLYSNPVSRSVGSLLRIYKPESRSPYGISIPDNVGYEIKRDYEKNYKKQTKYP